MIQQIEQSVYQHLDSFEQRIKRISVKLVSMILSCWMIVGSTALGVMLPAYLVTKVLSIKWPKQTEAGIEKAKEVKREPKITMSPRANFPMFSTNTNDSRSGRELKDQLRNMDLKGVRLISQGKEIEFRIPLVLLGNPDHILISAKTTLKDLTINETAWRVLSLEPLPVVEQKEDK